MKDPEVWFPIHSIKVSGNRDETVELRKLQQTECPVSILHRHPVMVSLVADVTDSMFVYGLTGAMPFGPDSGKWPARWYDAVMMIGTEHRCVEEAENLIGGS